MTSVKTKWIYLLGFGGLLVSWDNIKFDGDRIAFDW